MTSPGLPTVVADADWADWLASFPSPSATSDPANLLSELRSHIDMAPDVRRLSFDERKFVAEDLLAHAGEIESAMTSASDVGLLNLFVALAGVAAAAAIPTAAVTISLIPLVAASYVLMMGIAQRRREAVAMEIVELLRSTRRAIRR